MRLAIRSAIAGYTEVRRVPWVKRSAHVVVNLGRIEAVDFIEFGNRIALQKIDTQVDDRPLDVTHDQQPRGMHRARLATGIAPGPKSREQSLGEHVGPGVKCSNHSQRNTGMCQ